MKQKIIIKMIKQEINTEIYLKKKKMKRKEEKKQKLKEYKEITIRFSLI